MTSTGADPVSEPMAAPGFAPHQSGEGGEGRLNRQFMELLTELRVVLPGVQALFAFLLIVPFNERFARVGGVLRGVYVVALMASALACVLFMAPASFHRLRFRRHDKATLIQFGNRCLVAGLVMLAVAMLAAMFLVTDYLLDDRVAAVLTGLLAVVITSLWWIVPVIVGPPHRRSTD